MSVVTALNALGDVLDLVALTSPSFRVFRIPPGTLTSADLPAAILMHRGGQFTWHATQLRRTQYTIDVVLIVDAVGQQRMAERMTLAQHIYDNVTYALLDAPTLNATIDQIASLRDTSGYSVIQWAGVDYMCYTLTCDVVIKTAS